jgi:hypothetical protein
MSMTGKRWIATCSFFLEPHPELFPAGEKVYIPRDGLTVTLWFDGGLRVTGDAATLQLNFNTDEYLVVALQDGSRERIFRVPWQRLVSFELSRERNGEEASRDLFLNGRPKPDAT